MNDWSGSMDGKPVVQQRAGAKHKAARKRRDRNARQLKKDLNKVRKHARLSRKAFFGRLVGRWF